MKDTILLVDDERDIRQVLRLYLENAGYGVLEAENGEKAWEILENQGISLMILDIMMPELDGLGLMERLGRDRDFPIIFLSAKNQVEDKVRGLYLGADDYIAKPFDPSEVLARVMAVLRRSKKDGLDRIRVGDLTWDRENRKIYQKESLLDLTAKEYQVLSLFMKRPGKVYTKQEIYELLWQEPFYGDDNTIMVHISKLREKIEDNPRKAEKIITLRGIGYMLKKEEE